MSEKKLTVDEVAEGFDLASFFAQYQNISLRKLSDVAGVSYNSLLKASKAPIKGVPYDPDTMNFIAMALVLNKCKVDFSTIDFDALNKEARTTAVKDADYFNIGDTVALRTTKDVPQRIVYKNSTHIVFIAENDTKPISWSINTFLSNCPKHVVTALEIKAQEE